MHRFFWAPIELRALHFQQTRLAAARQVLNERWAISCSDYWRHEFASKRVNFFASLGRRYTCVDFVVVLSVRSVASEIVAEGIIVLGGPPSTLPGSSGDLPARSKLNVLLALIEARERMRQ